MIRNLLFSLPALALAFNTIAASPTVGLNFGADEVGGSLGAGDTAGVVPQANWNNLTGASGTSSSVVADNGGASSTTSISVEWSSPNTWASTGRGEENNGFTGTDKTLMTGYLDTTDTTAGVATVTVSGLGAEYSGGFDVIVYALGGVSGRGGAYKIGGTTLFGSSPALPSGFVQDLGADHTDTGTFLRFSGLTGSSFTLVSDASPGLGAGSPGRAPINGIQIIAVPEPSAIALTILGGAGILGLIRRRQ